VLLISLSGKIGEKQLMTPSPRHVIRMCEVSEEILYNSKRGYFSLGDGYGFTSTGVRQ